MRLLNSQKNTLFELIERSSLHPLQFEFIENNGTRSHTTISLKNGDFYFKLEDTGGLKMVTYSPSDENFVAAYIVENWDSALAGFEDWLYYLKREINIVDKWENLHKEMDGIKLKVDDNHSKDNFSAQEYEVLKSNMLVLKQGINSIGLLPEQLEILNEKLDFLTESAIDMKKFDWKSLFIGTIFSIIASLAFTPENSKALWLLIKQVFNNYFLP